MLVVLEEYLIPPLYYQVKKRKIKQQKKIRLNEDEDPKLRRSKKK